MEHSIIYFLYSVVVRTLYGDVKGFTVPWHTDDLDWDPDWEEHPPWYTRRINCFLGFPYASPPIGNDRFRVSLTLNRENAITAIDRDISGYKVEKI